MGSEYIRFRHGERLVPQPESLKEEEADRHFRPESAEAKECERWFNDSMAKRRKLQETGRVWLNELDVITAQGAVVGFAASSLADALRDWLAEE